MKTSQEQEYDVHYKCRIHQILQVRLRLHHGRAGGGRDIRVRRPHGEDRDADHRSRRTARKRPLHMRAEEERDSGKINS